MEKLTYEQLNPVAQQMVATAEGWDGTCYTNKEGVKVTLHGDGDVAQYSVEYPAGQEPQEPVAETTPETVETGLESVPQGTENGPVDPATVTGPETEPTIESDVAANDVSETTDTTENNVEPVVADTENAPTEPETV